MNDEKKTKDDYLWDGSGEPDPEIQRLESALGRFRHNPDLHPAPVWPETAAAPHRTGWRAWLTFPRLAPALIMAALVLAEVLFLRWPRGPQPINPSISSWQVSRLAGSPLIGENRIAESGRLAIGQMLVTDASSRANITVGKIGEVEVEPNSRVRLVQARMTENRLALDRGTIHALISAPPRLFFVDTPSAVAVDLGCAYTLQVDDQGVGLLRVTFGWVEFETHGQQSLIPSGAAAITKPGIGPGTPFFEDASDALKTALEKLDFENLDPQSRAAALHTILAEARKRDGFTLLNLLRTYRGMSEPERALIYDRLAALIPPPPGVSREPMVRGDNYMVGLWWDLMGVGHPKKK
ncbi:MAG TPA: FecR domain-containing protein [Terriglobia bacterium]|nr:FecR domain-containing protein [Terriglobia bacterium]